MNLRFVAKLQPSPNRHLCGRAVMIAVLVVNFVNSYYYSVSSVSVLSHAGKKQH